MTAHPAADLFPMLAGDELQLLAGDIADRGLLHPIMVDAEGLILDGRNRLAACQLVDVEPRFTRYEGDDPIGFVVAENIRRRHLNESQRAMLALRILPLYEAEAAQRTRGPARKEWAPGPTQKRKRARDHAAQVVGSSGRSVARAKRVTEQAPDLIDKVDAGQLELKRAERLARDRAAEIERTRIAREYLPASDDAIDIRAGDFRDVLADLDQVDAIITDPPYPREFLPLLDDLARFADKVLTDDGILAVMFGQTHLPEVYRRLDGGRPYRWTMAYLTSGNAYTSQARRLQSNWKPVLIYGGGPRFNDTVSTAADDKQHHHWGQDYVGIGELVTRLTHPGQHVVDPFLGGGTTAIACRNLGRRFTGCDIDTDAIQTSLRRLQ